MSLSELETGRRRIKLICTIGPASSGRIAELLSAGMDIARINFAHGSKGSHARAAEAVRGAAAATGRPVAIITDLAGPKIRLGELSHGTVTVETGARFVVRIEGAVGALGDASGAPVSYPRLARDVRVGDAIFLADGAVELLVTSVGGDVDTEVVRGGVIRSRAGVSIPASRLSAPPLTKKDLADIPRAIEVGAAYVAQSFVRDGRDVAILREALGRDGPPIIAKIETRPAVESFDAILEVADAVMIARGDLGVELPYEEVPLIQKQLVRRALERGVPSIVATQMLESMIGAPRPTRAEASDVANAVFDGADAIMLSGETAIGRYPVEATRAAGRIAALSEARGTAYLTQGTTRPGGSDAGAIALAAVTLASADPGIEAIVCYTRTGWTARVLSSLRPRVPIIAFSANSHVVTALALVHGVRAFRCAPLDKSDPLPQLMELLGNAPILGGEGTVALLGSTGVPGSPPNLLAVQDVPAPSKPGATRDNSEAL